MRSERNGEIAKETLIGATMPRRSRAAVQAHQGSRLRTGLTPLQ